jgi:hypothetical protein
VKPEQHQRATSKERKVAGAHRSRESQHKQNAMHNMIAGGMPPQGGANDLIDEELQSKPEDKHDALHDSVEPPPPQLRRARSTSDPSKGVKDKNRGIKGRDASGKKHTPPNGGNTKRRSNARYGETRQA